jgi:uncharacterized membrane protein
MLLADGPCVVDDLDGRVNPTMHRALFTEMKTALMADGDEVSGAQQSSDWWVKLAAVVWLLPTAWVTFALTAPSSTLSNTAKWFVLGPLLVLSAVQVRAWPRGDFVYTSPELAAVQGPWQQWRDWILHFDQMNDAPDLGVILWERAFAGALMWGVAEQFVERAKVLVPDLNEGTLALGHSAFYGAGIGSSISSSAAPPASAFGGGGGFGGGDGGGGGGGAW